MASPDPLLQIFDDARTEFEKSLPSNVRFQDILAVTSADKLWDAMNKLQEEQAKRRRMRWLGKIGPFIERLESLSGVIEVFVQAKPEIMALVWGPIKLVLMCVSQWSQAFDAIVERIERIGDLLPQFNKVLPSFINDEHIKDVVAHFFRDILEFYTKILQFFTLPRAKIMWETVWPKRIEAIREVEAKIKLHARLLRDNVTFEDIRRAEEARAATFRKFREDEARRSKEKFQALETAINPRMYDDRLSWLDRRMCPGTSDWLGQDREFCKWLDKSDKTIRLLWLQGIPGAGKTFLASWVAREAKKKGRVVYAFNSYIHTDATSISIMHSLLFQLASEDEDLQTILTESNKRDLKTNMVTAKELLTNALKVVGGAFVIVDGLDEVEEVERKLFLISLMDVLDACRDTTTKVCISSRAEHDITQILVSKGTTIRVDTKNIVGIQVYISSRYKQWMAESDFSSRGRQEIQALLSPISVTAKGMFLYARIIIDNVVDLANIDDVRRELRTLPANLGAAYERVFSRINHLPKQKQQSAKRILGWIGCSPTPLKQHELEQALLVAAKTYDDTPTVDSSLNIVKLCGPIVEVVDGTLRLVHFTVKEYLFEKGFVSMRPSILDLADTCVTYLCYDALGPDIEDDQLKENLLAGKYRFLSFASYWWFVLAKQYVRLTRDKTQLDDVNGLLRKLFSERENLNFEVDVDNKENTEQGQQKDGQPSQKRRQLWSGAPEFVSATVSFYRDKNDLWTVHNRDSWTCRDPLSISMSCARVDNLYQELLCHGREPKEPAHKEDCVCADLQRHYGKYLYKCHFFSCPARRNGFATDTECKHHRKGHSRPWKCSVSSCQWSEMGFTTKVHQERHQERYHKAVREGVYSNPSVMEDEALYPLLYELVISGNIDELEATWPSCRQKVNEFTKAELLTMAAGQGSLPMVQLFLEWDEDQHKPRNDAVKFIVVIQDAMQSANPELMRWVLCKAAYWGSVSGRKYRDVVLAVGKSESTDAFDIWQEVITSLLSPNDNLIKELFEKTVLTTINKYPDQDARLHDTWKTLYQKGLLEKNLADLGRALTTVARTTLSIEQATAILACGAPIDYPRTLGGTGHTALHWACKNTSREAARFIKFLLAEGANPFTSFGKLAAEEEGARKIETWLNVTWDDLMEWAFQQRRSKGLPILRDKQRFPRYKLTGKELDAASKHAMQSGRPFLLSLFLGNLL